MRDDEMASQMLTERRGAALLMTLSEPATRNALSPQACAAGIEAIGTAEADDDIRAVVLQGDGAHFCAGGNVARLQSVRHDDPALYAESMSNFLGLVEALRTCPKPVIAAVEGHAAGGGCSLALACDLIVAAEDAHFTMSYARIGLSPDGGGLWTLARAIPRPTLLKMLWLPEAAPARAWAELGLVTAVVGHGQALNESLALAERLATMAPNALASVKELVDAAPRRTLREQLDLEREHFVRNLFHPNGGEGLQAFVEKRKPRFA